MQYTLIVVKATEVIHSRPVNDFILFFFFDFNDPQQVGYIRLMSH